MAVTFSERVARPARGARKQVPRVRRTTHIDEPEDITTDPHGWSGGVDPDLPPSRQSRRVPTPPKPPRARRLELDERAPEERTEPPHGPGVIADPRPLLDDNDDDLVSFDDQGGVTRQSRVRTNTAPAPVKTARPRMRPEDLPGALPEKPSAGAKVGITLRPITDDDLDRLWDWVRLDKDGAVKFLDPMVTTSRALHAKFAEMQADAEKGTAALYAVDRMDVSPNVHIGFLILSPIMAADHLALTHVYITAPLRGRLGELAPELFMLAQTEHPTLSCLIKTRDAAMARMLGRLGFDVTYMLTKKG